MTQDKTDSATPIQLRLTERESLQIDRHAKNDLQGGLRCICTARSLLAVLRGAQAPLCTSMPWSCPRKQMSKTREL